MSAPGNPGSVGRAAMLRGERGRTFSPSAYLRIQRTEPFYQAAKDSRANFLSRRRIWNIDQSRLHISANLFTSRGALCVRRAAENERSRMTRETIPIDLALQGGGAHGAFTWGVLDRLLEEEWLKVEGVSGTSAGAMNAAAFISGYVAGARRARARRSSCSGAACPKPRAIVRCSAVPWMSCSAAGRSTALPSSLRRI